MRWSSTLTLVVIEFLALSLPVVHALPLPEDFDLYARNPTGQGNSKGKAKDIKDSSKNYRDNARQATTSFDHDATGALSQVHHTGPHTPQKGQDADHTYEAQTAHHALGTIGHSFGGLHTPVRQDLKEKFNDPKNMMFVDKSTNRSKGALTGQALAGPLKHGAPTRADHQAYLPEAHRNALGTAKDMDDVLKKHGVQGAHDSPFRKTEERVQQNFGMGASHQSSSHTPHTPPQGSPHSSHHSSPHGSP
jgi:hypothetical protein